MFFVFPSINETSGVVRVAGPLNHNEAAVIILPIIVVDKNASDAFPDQTDLTEVTLYIQAFSDKNPIFAPPWTPSRPQLQVMVKEEQEQGTKVFSVMAKDPITGQLVQPL
ncbi:hypothetical protein GWK47_020697 [Chionoecetes opilio]|uniref:Cadherin domain-containing protein n=1 Tax=Chionoecetes opilio TaxID=41210 RepID=A0A8J5CI87_CHIOP|nr:hypothetical protein GWK47_020697 [Chionoecetes opilio]